MKTTMAMSDVYLADEAATEAFGRLLARATLSPERPGASLGGRIFLHGDLGAGKTTLSRGVLREYGHTGPVKSPTYTLVEPYEMNACSLYHFDLYRLEDPEEVEFLGVFDYFDRGNVCLVEWAERGAGFLPAPDLELTLTNEGAGRRIAWTACSAHGEHIAQRLSDSMASLNSGMNVR